MRHVLWVAALAGFALSTPMAHAQSDSGTKAGAYTGPRGMSPPGLRADPVNPANCGTPDEPKACPPMPRNPLPYYQGDRRK